MLSFSASLYPRYKKEIVRYYIEVTASYQFCTLGIENNAVDIITICLKKNHLHDKPLCMSLLESEDADPFLGAVFFFLVDKD